MQDSDKHNRGGMIAFVFSMVFSLVFFVWISFLHQGIDLKEVPAEATQAAGDAKSAGAATGFDINKVEKPWVTDEKVAAYGATVFKANCAVCHGDGGMGDGPAGKSLQPPPRNLVEGKWKAGGDSISLFNTIKNGLQVDGKPTAMAPFGHLPVKDRWALVQYIHSITKNKVPDNEAKLDAFAKGAN